ncbi:MAG: PQQ-binding-like beta-propeller repeat protein [Anaerolineae bacterium]|nr:PQQ-binding-like beta-propeller repeat protein [Anaerolineae bacterium]
MGDKVYGSTGNIGHLFSYDPATGTSTDLGEAIVNMDSIRSLTVHDGLIYGGTGVYNADGRLFAYDPTQPFNPGVNPVDLGIAVTGEDYINCLAADSGGRIYGGTGWYGHLFYYDTASPGFVDLGPPPSSRSIYSLAVAPDDTVYGGTYLGYLFSYNPSGGGFSNLGQPIPTERYIHALAFGADGLLYGGSAYKQGRFFSYDPDSGTLTDMGRAAWGVNSVEAMTTDGSGNIYGAGEQLFFYQIPPSYHPPGTAVSADVIPGVLDLGTTPLDSDLYALTVGLDGRVYAGGGYGGHLYAYDPANGTISDLGLVFTDHYVESLTTGQNGRIYVGTYSWLGSAGRLFSYDPLTGQFTNLGVPTTWTEDAVSALATGPDGMIYGGTQGDSMDISGRFFSYDPITGTISQKGRVNDAEEFVAGIAAGSDGKVYIATGWNGYLLAYDPVADVWPPAVVWSNPVDGAVLSVAAGGDGRVYFGLGEDGHLMVYDPAGGVSDLGQPVSGAEEIVGLAASGDQLYGAANRYVYGRMQTHLFAYDTASGSSRVVGLLLAGEDQVNCLATRGGLLYAGTGYAEGHILSYDPGYTADMGWGTVHFTVDAPAGSDVQIDLLAQDGTLVLADVSDGQALDGIDVAACPTLKLQGRLTTTVADVTPAILDWGISWVTVQVEPASFSFLVDPDGPAILSDTISVDQTGDDGVNWALAWDQPWLSASPVSGTAPSAATLYADASMLAAGAYSGTVTVTWGISNLTHAEVITVSLFKPLQLVYVYIPLLLTEPGYP